MTMIEVLSTEYFYSLNAENDRLRTRTTRLLNECTYIHGRREQTASRGHLQTC